MPPINPNEVVWDDDAGVSIDPGQVSWDKPSQGEEDAFQSWYSGIAKKTGLNPNPDDPQHFYDYRAAYKAGAMPDKTGHWPSQFKREGHPRMVVDGVNTKTGEPVDDFARLNKQLEDEALFGQRAFDQTMDLGQKSQQYDQENPSTLRGVTQRLKSKGQVAAHMLTGAVAFPMGLVAGTGALVRGEGAKGFQQAQQRVGEYFTPNASTIGELTPEAEATLGAVGKVTGALSKGAGAAAAAIGGEDWRAAGEVAGDIALIGMPIMARKVAHQYVGSGLKKHLADLIEKNNKIGLTHKDATIMAERLINQAHGKAFEATGKPMSIWQKEKAKRGFGRMSEELKTAREGGPSEPFSPEFAAEVAGPKRITGRPDAFSPADVPAGDIVGPLEPYSPELAGGIRQVRQRAALPNAQGFEMVGKPFGPPPPTIDSIRGGPRTNDLPPAAPTTQVLPPGQGQPPAPLSGLPPEGGPKPIIPSSPVPGAPSLPAPGVPGGPPAGPGAAPLRPGGVQPPTSPGRPLTKAEWINSVEKSGPEIARAEAEAQNERELGLRATPPPPVWVEPDPSQVIDKTPINVISPPEPPEIPNTRPTGKAVIQNTSEFPVLRVPTSKIEINPKELQFKLDVNASGEQKPLAGDWNDLASGNLLLWQRKDGKMFVANGHHRLAHAKRSKVPEVNAQVLREEDGFSVIDARRIAAESNILEGKGTIYDQAEYFRTQPEYTPDVARKRGVETKGYAIGKLATGNTYDLFRDRKIKPDVATEISTAAPGNESLQAVGVKFALSHTKAEPGEITHFIKAIELQRAPQTKGEQVDMFGFDDAAIRSAEQAAKKATKIIKELREDLNSISGASRRPARAKKLGVDVSNPAEVIARADQLKAEIASWEKWYNDPAKIALVEGTDGLTVKEPQWEFGGRIPFGAVEVVQPGDIKRQKVDKSAQGSLFGPEPGKEPPKKIGPKVEQVGMFDKPKEEPVKVEPKPEPFPEPPKKETAEIPKDPLWAIPGSGRPVKGEMVWENRFSKGAYGTIHGHMENSPEAAVEGIAKRAAARAEGARHGERIAAAQKAVKTGNYTDDDIKTLTGRGLNDSTTGTQSILRSLGLTDKEARKVTRNINEIGSTSNGTILFSVREAIEYASRRGYIRQDVPKARPVFGKPGGKEPAPDNFMGKSWVKSELPEKKAPETTFEEMVKEAARWRSAAMNADALIGEMQDKAEPGARKELMGVRVGLTKLTTKGDLDAYLKRKYGIDDSSARDVSNELTRKNIPRDKAVPVEDYRGEPWADKALEMSKKAPEPARGETPSESLSRIDKESAEFARWLTKFPVGTKFEGPRLKGAKALEGTWVAVDVSGDRFWKNNKTNEYRSSGEFDAIRGEIKEQLSAPEKPREQTTFIGKADKQLTLFEEQKKYSAGPVWFSKMAEVLTKKLPNSGTPETYLDAIRSWSGQALNWPSKNFVGPVHPTLSEFTKNELKWSGLEEWLKEQKGKITKAEVLDFLKANRVEVREVVKGEKGGEKLPDGFTVMENPSGVKGIPTMWVVEGPGPLEHNRYASGGTPEQAIENFHKYHTENQTKFSTWVLPGGENYKELLLTLPSGPKQKAIVDRNGNFLDWADENDLSPIGLKTIEKVGHHIELRENSLKGKEQFTSGHFDEPNIFAHVRMSDRIGTTPDNFRKKISDLSLGISDDQNPFHVMQSSMEGMRKYAQIRRVIVENIPVDVVDSLRPFKIAPDELLSGKAVSASLPDIPAQIRGRILNGIALATEKTVTDLRAKIIRSLIAGLNNEILPTLRTSDLDTNDLRNILTSGPVNKALLGSTFETETTSARTTTGGLRGVGNGNRKLSSTELTRLLDIHKNIIQSFGGDVKRINDRTNAQGERVLFLEEIQSDWAIEGRKKGYDEHNRVGIIDPFTGEPFETKFTGVPPFPFSGNWHEVAMKRMLRYAAENGYDRVAWINGEETAKRYDLSKHFKEIAYHKYEKSPTDGVEAGEYHIEGILKNGELHNFGTFSESGLADAVGKDLAEKIIAGEGEYSKARIIGREKGAKVFSGLDLKIGGKWAFNLYDKMIPEYLKKYGKKWGAGVEGTEIQNIARKESVYTGPKLTRKELNEIAKNLSYNSDVRIAAISVKNAMGNSDLWAVFNGAMEEYGNVLLANAIGGKLERVDNQTTFSSIPITDAMRGAVMTAGQSLFEPKKEYSALHNELVKQRGYQYDIFTSIEEKKLTLAALTDLKKIEDLLSKERGGETSKTRGKAISTELIQKGFVDYRGWVVKDLNELVALCQVFRDARYETSRWIYVKYLDGGKMEIRGHHGVTTRLPGETRIFSQESFDQARYDLERRKERLGADAYFTLHNHPTGVVDPSIDDEFSIQSLGEAYHRRPAEKNLPSLGGMIIIDHEKYAFLLPDPGKPHPQIAYGDISTGKEDPLLKPEINHALIGAEINSPADLATIAKHIELDKAFNNTVLFLSAKNEIRGIHDVHESVIKRKDFNGYLRNRAREFGATRAVVVTTNGSLKGRLIDLYRQSVLLEAMIVSPNKVFSVVNEVPWIGPDPDEKLWMGKPDRAMKVASPVIAFGQADPRHVILNDKLVAQKKDLSKLQRERDNLDAKVKRLDKHIGTLKTEEAKRINTELRRRAKLQRVDRERKIVDLTDKIHVTERAITNLAVGPNTIVKRRQMGEKSENRFAPPVTQREFEVIKDLATRPPMRGSYREWFETAPRMFDHYGKMVKEMFYRPATAARYAAHKETRAIFKQIDKQFEKLPKKSSRRIGIYAVAQQPNGMRLLKEAGIDVVPTLTAQEDAVYRWARDLLTDTYNRLQAARKTAGQKPFAPVQDYFTFMRNFSFWDRWGLNPATADLNLLPEYEVHLRTTPFRFAKKRVKATYPVEINARFILKNYMKSALNHIHVGPEIAKMRELLGRYEINKKEFILRDENPLAYNQITQWVDFVSGTKPATNLPETVQKVIKALSRNIVASTLSFSVRSTLIQPTALLQTWTRLGTRPMLASVPAMFQPSEWKRAFNTSNHLSIRIMDIALERAVEELWGPVSRAKAKTTGWGFSLMSALDYVAANYTWLAADWTGKKLGLSGDELTNFADDITIATQGSGAKEDISRIQRTVLGHAAMLFQTFSINQWGFFLRDTLGIKGAEKLSKKEILRRVLYFLVGTTIINTVYEDILGMPSPLPTPVNSYLRAKDEGKTTAQALLSSAYSLAGMVPGMGGMRFGSTPMGAVADWTLNVAKKGAEWGGLKGQYVQPAPEIAMRGLGIPGTSQVFKTVRGLDKGQSLPEALLGTTKSSTPGKARVKRPAPGFLTKFLGIRSARKQSTRKREDW